MNDEIVDDLIQRVLDGEATPQEARRLEARLASDPVVRERHAELKRVFDGLAAVDLEDAPAGLHASIMSAVRAQAPALAPRAAAATPRAARRPIHFLRLLMPVAAGFIAGSLGWAAYSGALGPAALAPELSGAMTDLSQPVPLLSLGGIDKGVTVSAGRAEKGATMLELQSAEAPVRLWLASDDKGVTLVAEPSAGARLVEGAEGVLVLDVEPKSLVRVRCTPLRSSQTVRVTAKPADGSVAEGILRLEWLPWAKRIK